MPRSTKEWIGKNDDVMPPPSVRVRIFDRFGGVCQCGCERKIQVGETWHCDHIKPLADGGKNIESNFRPLIEKHHIAITSEQNSERAKVRQKRMKHLGIKKPSTFQGARNHHLKKKIDGTVVDRRTGEPV